MHRDNATIVIEYAITVVTEKSCNLRDNNVMIQHNEIARQEVITTNGVF